MYAPAGLLTLSVCLVHLLGVLCDDTITVVTIGLRATPLYSMARQSSGVLAAVLSMPLGARECTSGMMESCWVWKAIRDGSLQSPVEKAC